MVLDMTTLEWVFLYLFNWKDIAVSASLTNSKILSATDVNKNHNDEDKDNTSTLYYPTYHYSSFPAETRDIT